MSNAKHTPGPWNFAHGTDDLLTHEGGDVAYIDTRIPERPMHEQKANAQLIKAAPDLLEIASAILARMDLEPVSAQFPASAMREDLRRAIAKATA